MLKIILPVIALVFLLGFASFKLIPSLQKPSQPNAELGNAVTSPIPESEIQSSSLPLLEEKNTSEQDLLKRVNELSKAQTKIKELENKIKSLENNQSDFNQRLAVLENKQSPAPVSSTATTTSTSPAKAPVFIPVNPGGSINSSDWANLSSGTVTINPTDYPGYTSMNLIISLNVYQGNGRAYARLVDTSSGNAVVSSETSTTSENATQVASNSFTLPSGQATYTIQLKTLTVGYPSIAGWSFIKVNF